MVKRTIGLILAVVFLTIMLPGAFAEAVSAQEALFGDAGSVPQDNPVQAAEAQDGADSGDEDMYGANDNASATTYPTLQKGDTDAEDGVAYIVFLQNRLIELGFLNDEADGYYGENTLNAVKDFQKSNGLQETGIADPFTQEKLYSDASGLVAATSNASAFGGEIMRVQNALVQWGFMFSRVDGKMGDNTRLAIKNFKKYVEEKDPNYAVMVTPTPAPTEVPVETSSTIFGDMPVAMDVPMEKKDAGDIDDLVLQYVDGLKPFPMYSQVVRNGDTGEETLRVQKRLKSLKYLYSADGTFGGTSELALKYFQRKNGLSESGVADQQTQEKLFSASAQPAEEYVFPYKIIVDISDQRVYVGSWNGSMYKDLVKKMKCSTGKDRTPTPLGTYQSVGQTGDEWYYFREFNCYAKWATRIVGGILFHSITYNSHKGRSGSERSLGRKASHGCIRLSVADAKWIYDNCPAGTTVVIQE